MAVRFAENPMWMGRGAANPDVYICLAEVRSNINWEAWL